MYNLSLWNIYSFLNNIPYSELQESFFVLGLFPTFFAIQKQCWHMHEMTNSISVLKEFNQNQSTVIY